MEHFFVDSELGNLLYIFFYFLPVLVGYLRKRADPNRQIPFGVIFVVDLFFAWTLIGWIVAMAIACGGEAFVSEGSDSAPASDWQPLPQGWDSPQWQPAPQEWQPQQWQAEQSQIQNWMPPEPTPPCCRCQDRGETCPICYGNRGKYEQPAGENGVAIWHSCTYCCGSGRVQCTLCGKTG